MVVFVWKHSMSFCTNFASSCFPKINLHIYKSVGTETTFNHDMTAVYEELKLLDEIIGMVEVKMSV
jgi:hypothetical protein